jgi:hypothetical protein
MRRITCETQGFPLLIIALTLLCSRPASTHEEAAASQKIARVVLDHDAPYERLGAEVICWERVVGVHQVPDYAAKIDYDNL